MNPEVLIGMLAELERIRELTLDLVEQRPRGCFRAPPDEAAGAERTVFDLLLGARRAVLGNPAAARGLHDLLVAEGRALCGDTRGRAAARRADRLRSGRESPPRLGDGEPQRPRRPRAAQLRPRPRGPNCWPTRSSGTASTTPSWPASGPRASHDAHRSARGTRRAEQLHRLSDGAGRPGPGGACAGRRRRPPSRAAPRCRRLRPRAAGHREPREMRSSGLAESAPLRSSERRPTPAADSTSTRWLR